MTDTDQRVFSDCCSDKYFVNSSLDNIFLITNREKVLEVNVRTLCDKRTSDGANGNHSVSLPIILIKIKVDQLLPSSYITSLLVSIL